jgi:hypothetical protein
VHPRAPAHLVQARVTATGAATVLAAGTPTAARCHPWMPAPRCPVVPRQRLHRHVSVCQHVPMSLLDAQVMVVLLLQRRRRCYGDAATAASRQASSARRDVQAARRLRQPPRQTPCPHHPSQAGRNPLPPARARGFASSSAGFTRTHRCTSACSAIQASSVTRRIGGGRQQQLSDGMC